MQSPTKEIFKKYTDPEQFERIIDYDSVSEMWQASVTNYPDTVAIEDDGKRYTYAQIEADVSRLRTVIKSDDDKALRVGVYCPNSYDFVRSFLAVTTLGYTAVILPAQLDAMTVFGCTMKYGLDMILYHPSLQENTAITAEKRPDVTLIASDTQGDTATEMAFPTGDTPCVIMFTGGTTGKSKGAQLSNAAVMQGTVNGCYGYRDVFHQRYLLILPLSHVFGLIRNLTTSLYTGSTLFICRNNKDMFRDIAVFRPTILVAVPALAEMALNLSKKFQRNMLGDSLKAMEQLVTKAGAEVVRKVAILAEGEAVRGMISLCEQQKAVVVGVGIAVEKGFQPGGRRLREAGVHLKPLAVVDGIEEGKILLRPEAD